MTFPAPSRLLLDGEALVANWKTMARLSGKAGTGAAVKADAYGLGAREVVRRLWTAGCRDFFVAHWSEAEAIIDLVPASSVAVLNGVCEADLVAALAIGAVPVLNTPHQLSLWKAAGGAKCHVMLDSGINRLGIGPDQLSSGLFVGLDIDILMSHLASADQDVPQNAEQLAIYTAMSAEVTARRLSLANSAGIALGQQYHFDLTRPGLSLYGGIARAELHHQLRQVVKPQVRILQVRNIRKGSKIGYNATWVAQDDAIIATMAFGYADGYYRAFSNNGMVRVEGIDCPVIGRVSMDLTTVDVTRIPSVAEGDICEVGFDLARASHESGMSQYELLTGLSHRSERLWT